MNRTFSRAKLAGLALGLIAGLGLLSPHLAARDLPHSTLMAADGSGVPAGFTSQQWLSAEGEARVVTQEDGHDVIEFEASGLVPEGLYTFWWVSRGILGTSMGPGGGTPDNEFTADGDGNATAGTARARWEPSRSSTSWGRGLARRARRRTRAG
jgi:hypothetical protein